MARIPMHHILLCVGCSLAAGGLLVAVTAEPSVSAWIVTPEADLKEGGQVHMRCIATNLESDHIVEWRTEVAILSWGTNTVTNNRRFSFETTLRIDGGITDFTIIDLQRGDTDEYVCNVNDPIHGGGNTIVANANVQLSVLYFPGESFPMCSPINGSIAVKTGTQLNMRCSSDSGNSAVRMEIFTFPPRCNRYILTAPNLNDTILWSMDWTVDAADEDAFFECTISSLYFPAMTRSCTIGPISVTGAADQATPTSTIEPPSPSNSITGATAPETTPSTYEHPSPSAPWIAAFMSSIFLLVASCIINVLLIRRDIKQKRHIKSLTARKMHAEENKGENVESPVKDKIEVKVHSYCKTITNHPESERGDNQTTPYEKVEFKQENDQ